GKNDPILSCDSVTAAQATVVATAGADAEVRLWLHADMDVEATSNQEPPQQQQQQQQYKFLVALRGHQGSVNAVRFSPDGLQLASAGDAGTIVVWTVKEAAVWVSLDDDKSKDVASLVLRCGDQDVYDLCWSPDSKCIICGAIDNRAQIWEVKTKRNLASLEDHSNYVQGVSWDPRNRLIATQSSDRTCRIYAVTPHKDGRIAVKKESVIKSLAAAAPDSAAEQALDESEVVAGAPPGLPLKPVQPDEAGAKGLSAAEGAGAEAEADTKAGGETTEGVVQGAETSAVTAEVPAIAAAAAALPVGAIRPGPGKLPGKKKTSPLFADGTVPSFFRRLAWTPDGSFLITPTAQLRESAVAKPQYCTCLFRRGNLSRPALCLSGLDKPSICIKACPTLFQLRQPERKSQTDLPYRMVFAVTTLDTVLVYDTEHAYPLAVASGLHYAGLTDVCWLPSGRGVTVTSNDGYVTGLYFEPGELGDPVAEGLVPEHVKKAFPLLYKRGSGEETEVGAADDMQVQVPVKEAIVGKDPVPQAVTIAAAEAAAAAGGSEQLGAGIGAEAGASPTHMVRVRKKIKPTLVSTPAAGAAAAI
ncbi:unnamed protein product, partial [Chrysoparadoxa australica]